MKNENIFNTTLLTINGWKPVPDLGELSQDMVGFHRKVIIKYLIQSTPMRKIDAKRLVKGVLSRKIFAIPLINPDNFDAIKHRFELFGAIVEHPVTTDFNLKTYLSEALNECCDDEN